MGSVDRYRRINAFIRYVLLIMVITILATMLRWLGPDWVFLLDLYLLVAVIHALRHPPLSSLFFALVLGMVQDVYGGSLFGLNALSKMLIAYVISSSKDLFLIHGLFQRVSAVILASIADRLLQSLVFLLFSISFSITLNDLLLTGLLHCICGLLVLIYLSAMDRRNRQVKPYAKSE